MSYRMCCCRARPVIGVNLLDGMECYCGAAYSEHRRSWGLLHKEEGSRQYNERVTLLHQHHTFLDGTRHGECDVESSQGTERQTDREKELEKERKESEKGKRERNHCRDRQPSVVPLFDTC